MRIGGNHRQTVRRADIRVLPQNHIAVAIAVTGRAEIRGISAEQLVYQGFGPDRVWIWMHTAEIRQRHAVHHTAAFGPQPIFKDFNRIGPGDRAHRIKPQPEPTRDMVANGVKVEQALHQIRVIRDRVNNIDHHVTQTRLPNRRQVDIMRFQHSIFGNGLRGFVNPVGDRLGRGPTICGVVFHAEIFVRAAGVVAGRHDDPAIGLVQTDQMRCRRCRQKRALPDDHPRRAIRRRHPQDHLRGTVIEIAPIPAKHQSFARHAPNPVKDGLHEILKEMALHEHLRLFTQTAGARLLPGNWRRSHN